MPGMTQKPSNAQAHVGSPQHSLSYQAMASCQYHQTRELGHGPWRVHAVYPRARSRLESPTALLSASSHHAQEVDTGQDSPVCPTPSLASREGTETEEPPGTCQISLLGGRPPTQGVEGTRLIRSVCLTQMPQTGSGPTRSYQGRFWNKPLCILCILRRCPYSKQSDYFINS